MSHFAPKCPNKSQFFSGNCRLGRPLPVASPIGNAAPVIFQTRRHVEDPRTNDQLIDCRFRSPLIRRLGYAGWLALLVMAVVFYRERAIFMDGAFQLVELINDPAPIIYHYRITNPLTHFLALLAVLLEWPLRWVLMAYSVNFVLFFGLVYVLIVRVLGNDFLGWVQLLFFTLLAVDSFYFLPPEFYQGISLLLLWLAILLRDPRLSNRWTLPGLVLLLVPVVFAHKLVSVFFLFAWLFFWLDQPLLRRARYYVLLAFFLVLTFVHSRWFADWYDTAKQVEFWNNFQTYFPNFHTLPANRLFLERVVTAYYWYPILLAAVLAGYAWAMLRPSSAVRAPGWKLLLVLAFNFGYLLVVHIGDPLSPYRFYSEVSYLGLSILLGIPLFFDFLSRVRREQYVFWGLALVLTSRLVTIAANHQRFEERLEWYLALMQDDRFPEADRFVLPLAQADPAQVIMPWPSSQESLLIATLRDAGHPKTVLIATDEQQYLPCLERDDCFLTSFKQMNIDELNRRYFFFERGRYILLP